MYHHFNQYKILQIFFDNPNKKFYLRELVRLTHISLPSVKRYVKMLLQQELVKEIHDSTYTRYQSSYTPLYKILKRNDLLLRLEESNFLNEVEEKCTPSCIILYGSAVEGTDDERGDIDIFIQSTRGKIDLKKYEKKLMRKISLLFEPHLEKIDSSLKNTLANGIVLHGFFKVI